MTAETAEEESEKALSQVLQALQTHRNFKLEAGAGAGKTYSLIHALQHILARRSDFLARPDQQIACLTYTKVARDEIIRRTDAHPSVFTDTLHGFLWEMIRPYQKSLRHHISNSAAWEPLLDGGDDLEQIPVQYEFGIRSKSDDAITLHHDDVPTLAIQLFGIPKFRSLIADRFPIVFIDEYQDTPVGLVEAMLGDLAENKPRPVFGFFGDHWQQIYENTCGSIVHPSVVPIPKNANFRSGSSITGFLNNLRPELAQATAADAPAGTVTIYHTNEWPGSRLGRNWKGQISHEATHETLAWVTRDVHENRWDAPSKDTKTLMLTHSAIANEVGYPSLPNVFKYNEAFVKKENPVVAFLIDVIEPALEAFVHRRFGQLFDVLGGERPHIRTPGDKVLWTEFFDSLGRACSTGTVGQVLDQILEQSLFSVPTRVRTGQAALDEAIRKLASNATPIAHRSIEEHQKLREVAYSEIRSLAAYLDDQTMFSTKHSVKGAEFDNVIVVVGRGWSRYDFAKMLGSHPERGALAEKDRSSYERARNLFYVAASRAKHNLVLLFTQELDSKALGTLAHLAGKENIVSVNFLDERTALNTDALEAV